MNGFENLEIEFADFDSALRVFVNFATLIVKF